MYIHINYLINNLIALDTIHITYSQLLKYKYFSEIRKNTLRTYTLYYNF